MKKPIVTLALAALVAGFFSACAGGGGSHVYRSHYGYGDWWGFPPYIDRRPIIVTPPPGYGDAVDLPAYLDTLPPEFEAAPLPAEPMMDMDIGMPELMDLGM